MVSLHGTVHKVKNLSGDIDVNVFIVKAVHAANKSHLEPFPVNFCDYASYNL